jgi:hypothetical protein
MGPFSNPHIDIHLIFMFIFFVFWFFFPMGTLHRDFKMESPIHVPLSSLLDLERGPTMLKSGNSWNLVSLSASNIKRGKRGVLKTPGLD